MKSAKPYVDAALALSRSHPHAPAIDVLNVALQGVDRQTLDFGPDGLPPAPFAMLVVVAHDNTVLTLEEWGWLANPKIDPKLATALLEIWRNTVWPRFMAQVAN
jgi:hypothetical protein